MVGLLGVALAGVLFARQQSTENHQRSSERIAQQTIAHLRRLYVELRKGGQPSRIDQAVLAATPKHQGMGGALRVRATSARFPDQVIVLVGGLSSSGAPYRVWLLGPHQRFRIPGYLALDNAGGGELPWSGRLSRYRSVQVRDAKGTPVLAGAFGSSP